MTLKDPVFQSVAGDFYELCDCATACRVYVCMCAMCAMYVGHI